MKHPAIKDLYNILKTKDWTSFCPEKNREELLNKWVDQWVMEVEQSQLVVDKKYLDSEHLDIVKYKLGEHLGQSLAEECVQFKTEERKISGHMVALRRKEKK